MKHISLLILSLSLCILSDLTGKEQPNILLSEHGLKMDHIVVMGHTPILRPVRTFSSSGMLTVKGRDSDFCTPTFPVPSDS
jgi:hypothetical protein